MNYNRNSSKETEKFSSRTLSLSHIYLQVAFLLLFSHSFAKICLNHQQTGSHSNGTSMSHTQNTHINIMCIHVELNVHTQCTRHGWWKWEIDACIGGKSCESMLTTIIHFTDETYKTSSHSKTLCVCMAHTHCKVRTRIHPYRGLWGIVLRWATHG